MSRAYTEDEVKMMIINHAKRMAKYWAELPDVDKATGHKYTIQDRCDGVVFSLFSFLDGCSLGFPAVDLVLAPHPEDKEFCQTEGENWFEEGMTISTMLHENFYK